MDACCRCKPPFQLARIISPTAIHPIRQRAAACSKLQQVQQVQAVQAVHKDSAAWCAAIPCMYTYEYSRRPCLAQMLPRGLASDPGPSFDRALVRTVQARWAVRVRPRPPHAACRPKPVVLLVVSIHPSIHPPALCRCASRRARRRPASFPPSLPSFLHAACRAWSLCDKTKVT